MEYLFLQTAVMYLLKTQSVIFSHFYIRAWINIRVSGDLKRIFSMTFYIFLCYEIEIRFISIIHVCIFLLFVKIFSVITLHTLPASRCKLTRRCAFRYKPVCGTNGKTYMNSCELRKARCMSNSNIKRAYKGRCGKSAFFLFCFCFAFLHFFLLFSIVKGPFAKLVRAVSIDEKIVFDERNA